MHRARTSDVKPQGRRSSILKTPKTGNKENKRRVSFSSENIIHPIGVPEKRVHVQVDPTPQLEDLLDEAAPPQFGVEQSNPPLEQTFGATNDWGNALETANYNVTMQFTGQNKLLPNSHAVSIDSIFGDDIDASAILPSVPVQNKQQVAGQSTIDLAEKTIDKWGRSAVNIEKEMEVTGQGNMVGGALDSKTYDFDPASAGTRNWNLPGTKTTNAAADMSLATMTQAFDAPRTIRFETNMSGIAEESDVLSAPAKTVNVAMPMDLSQQSMVADANLNNTQLLDAPAMGKEDENNGSVSAVPAKTVNFATDMDLATGQMATARTVNFGMPMDVDSSGADPSNALDESRVSDARRPGSDDLNQGFTKDWAAGAALKTVNFAAPMEVDEEEEEEEEEEERENADEYTLAMLSSTSHLAAADAVRKSLEAGELMMGRSSLSRKSVERLSLQERASFGRLSPPRESLNRSELLSPVEEAAEDGPEEPQEEPMSPLPPPDRVLVPHPIAGVPVAAPKSRLPALFDRRYSTRRIIKNFGRPSDAAAAPASPPAALEATAPREVSSQNDSLRRISMRQSIAPGELPVSDFLWLANIRFVDEATPVAPVPSAALSNGGPASLISTEEAALLQELEQLTATAAALRESIAEEEDALSRAFSNPLLSAVQTSDQQVLLCVQTQLAELKRVCVLQAETETLSAAVGTCAAARQSFRQLGERAVRDARQAHQLAGQLHAERETLRAAKLAAGAALCRAREERARAAQSALQAASGARLVAAALQALTHCALVSPTEMDICETVRVSVGPAGYACSLLPNVSAWRASLASAAGVLTTSGAGTNLMDVATPIRAKLLRCNAGANELRTLARRFNIIYSDASADVYFSSKTATAILHIPCAAIANYPSAPKTAEAAPRISIIKSAVEPARLHALLREPCAGIGCFGTLINRVATEFSHL